MLRISVCLDALDGAQYFTIFDIRSAYHQVLMEPVDAEKTAFVTRGGLYEYRLKPFGLCNAPATFNRLIDLTLSDLTFLILLVYLHDIIVYSKTRTEHIERLELLFRRLAAANLKLIPSKWFLVEKKVVFLGHAISDKGQGTEDNKIESVIDWSTPKSFKNIRGFLGLCSFYRRFGWGFYQYCISAPCLTTQKCSVLMVEWVSNRIGYAKKCSDQYYDSWTSNWWCDIHYWYWYQFRKYWCCFISDTG